MADSALQEMIDLLRKMDSATVQAMYEPAKELVENKKMTWLPNPGPQFEAYYSGADQLLYGGQAGGGKMQCTDNKVLTPFGWTEIGKLKVGSKICATDGTVTEVIGVYPQGVMDLYRVTMSDGGSTEAGLDHNWLAWRTDNSRKIGNERVGGPASAAVWKTSEMIARMEQAPRSDGRSRGFAIPVAAPAALNVAGSLVGRGNFISRPVDPYFLGLLIGDGSVTRLHGMNITSMDDEIAAYLRELALEDLRVNQKEGNAASSFCFRGAFAKKLWADLESLGIAGARAGTKSIPRQYLFAPVEERWALLQGLCDTDGWVEPKRAVYYTTISKQLADDVVHLARSLGVVVSATEKRPTYTHEGEKKDGQLAYCLRFRMANPERCFRLTRKREVASEIQHQSEGRFIEKIEFSRKAEAVCIQVRHPNSLYITDDFIVTHNSDLLIGLATQEHDRSLLLRRQNLEVADLYERAIDIVGHDEGFSKSPQARWNMPDGRLIMFGGCQNVGDEKKFKGQAKDLIGIDEATEFLEAQIDYVTQWLRTKKRGQRCRLVLATNPPTTPEGEWVIKWFAPWIDKEHPLYGKVKEGELLYWCRLPDDSFRFEFEPFEIGRDGSGDPIMSLSRTFIRSTLADNPDLAEGGSYAAQLASKPEALRRRYERGEFISDPDDDEWQIIPTLWVMAAQERWRQRFPNGAAEFRTLDMTAMGVDVAQGGKDSTVLSRRYGEVFDELLKFPGEQTPDGPSVAGLILKYMRSSAQINIDLGGGWGGSTYDHLKDNDAVSLFGFVPSGESTARSRDGKMRFKNTRTEALWLLREALEPSSEFNICLPPDTELRADLCAVRWRPGPGGLIVAESKDDIKKRIGRSPDKGDAVMISWFTGARRQRHGRVHEARKRITSLPTMTNAAIRNDRRRMPAGGRGRGQPVPSGSSGEMG